MPGLHNRIVEILLAGVLAGAGPAAAQALLIARVDAHSMVSDVCERVMVEAGRRTGISMSFRRLPLARSLAMADAGDIDGDVCRGTHAIDGHPNLVIVPTTVAVQTLALYTREPDVTRRTAEDMRRLRLAYPRGSHAAEASTRGLNRTAAPNVAAALSMLGNRVDAALLQHDIAEEAIERLPNGQVLRWPRPWVSSPLHFVLHRRHAALVPRLDAALQAMHKEGVLERYLADDRKRLGIAPMPGQPVTQDD